MGDQLKVFGFWYSPFSKKVEIALKIKGVEYEYVDEDRYNKSEELLKFNPIHKKIPVLVHNGKHMAESQVILEYIDETWNDNGDALLLPTDPYERAQARFWAKFIDDKLMPAIREALLTSEGKEGEKLDVEAEELLKIFDNELNGKKLFGGNKVGFLDIVGIVIAHFVPILQEVMGKELITKDKYPNICAWADHLLGCSVIQENLAPRVKVAQFLRDYFAAACANK